MKILFYNIQYGTGINKGGLKYPLSLWRYFLAGKMALVQLEKFIEKVDADILAFDEIDSGSVRTLFRSQVEYLSSDIYHSYFFNCKYSNFFRHLPIFRKQGNAILSKHAFEYRAHRLVGGLKDLVIEVVVSEKVSIFLVHLSLTRRARQRQFDQLSDMLKFANKEVIIVGDFNTDLSNADMKDFAQKNNLHSPNLENAKTFPAWKPRHELDHFLVSSKIQVNSFQVFENVMSDHLPLLLDYTLT